MISIAFTPHHLCDCELWSMQLLVPSERGVSEVSKICTLEMGKNEKKKKINPKRFIAVRKENHLL